MGGGHGQGATDPGAERKAAARSRWSQDGSGTGAGYGHCSIGRLLPFLRFAETYQALMDGRLPPYLLATPTHVNGRLDAAELVERLEGYERAGIEALSVDLQQALLRLSRYGARRGRRAGPP